MNQQPDKNFEEDYNDIQYAYYQILEHDMANMLKSCSISSEIMKFEIDSLKKMPFDFHEFENKLELIQNHISRARQSYLRLFFLFDDYNNLIQANKAKLNILLNQYDLVNHIYNWQVYFPDISIKMKYFISQNKIYAVYDEEILKHVYFNLVMNAFRYSNKDQSIEIHLIVQDKKVLLKVKNYGSHISASAKSKIFKKFNQLNQDDDSKGVLGIGLAFCKLGCQQMNGEIHYESLEEEMSTTFIVSLPAVKSIK